LIRDVGRSAVEERTLARARVLAMCPGEYGVFEWSTETLWCANVLNVMGKREGSYEPIKNPHLAGEKNWWFSPRQRSTQQHGERVSQVACPCLLG
jgi:hypothetical protein